MILKEQLYISNSMQPYNRVKADNSLLDYWTEEQYDHLCVGAVRIMDGSRERPEQGCWCGKYSWERGAVASSDQAVFCNHTTTCVGFLLINIAGSLWLLYYNASSWLSTWQELVGLSWRGLWGHCQKGKGESPPPTLGVTFWWWCR